MNITYFLFYYFIIVKSIWTRIIQYESDNGRVFREYIEECKYINPLISKNEKFNCCRYRGIYCNIENPTEDEKENKKKAHITQIWLGKRKLKTSIPDTIGELKELTDLNLYNCELQGPLPSSFGNLKKLKYLNIDNNQLSGKIPESIGDMSSLEGLSLNNNSFEGIIPSSIGKIKPLRYIELHNNKLKGSFPSSIGNLYSLQWIDLRNNKDLIGPLPSSISKLPFLNLVDVRGTNLCYTDDTFYYGKYVDYKCSKCKKNASLINGICECNDGFSGIGYINCENSTNVNEIEKVSNSNKISQIYSKYEFKLLLIILLINIILIFKLLINKYCNKKNKK